MYLSSKRCPFYIPFPEKVPHFTYLHPEKGTTFPCLEPKKVPLSGGASLYSPL